MKKNNKNQYSKKASGGFTLIELLAVIAVLSLVVSIGMYSIASIIRGAKEKTYETTKNEIEDAAGDYSLENDKDLVFVPTTDGNTEHQCISVKDLIDTGFLDKNVVNSYYANGQKVGIDDYVWLERDVKTKTVIQKSFTGDSDIAAICGTLNTTGDIIYENPSGWAKVKTVNVTYRLFQKKKQVYEFKSDFSGGITKYGKYESLSEVTHIFDDLDKNGLIESLITASDGTKINNRTTVSQIDTLGPVIVSDVLTGMDSYYVSVDGNRRNAGSKVNLAEDNTVSVFFQVADCRKVSTVNNLSTTSINAAKNNGCSGMRYEISNPENVSVMVNGKEIDSSIYKFNVSKHYYKNKRNDSDLYICGNRTDEDPDTTLDRNLCGDGLYRITLNFKDSDVTKRFNGPLSIKFSEGVFSDYNNNPSLAKDLNNIVSFDNGIKLELDPNGGTYKGNTSVSTLTMKYGTSDNKDVGVASRNGYTFKGWYTSKSGGTQVFGADGKFNKGAKTYWSADGTWLYDNNLKLYANWTKNDTTGPNIGVKIKYYDSADKSYKYYNSNDYYSTCSGTKDSTQLPSSCSQSTKWFKYKPTLEFEITDANGVNDQSIGMVYNKAGYSSLSAAGADEFTGATRKVSTNADADQDKTLKKINGKYYTNIGGNGARSFKITACDTNGNCSYKHIFFKFDSVAPEITFSMSPNLSFKECDNAVSQVYDYSGTINNFNAIPSDCESTVWNTNTASPNVSATITDSYSGVNKNEVGLSHYDDVGKNAYSTSIKGTIGISGRNKLAVSGNTYSYTISLDGARHLRIVACDNAKNCSSKHITYKQEKSVKLEFNVDAIKSVKNCVGNTVFNTGKGAMAPSNSNSGKCRISNDSTKCVSENTYFGVSCMDVVDYDRVFTVTAASINGGKKTIKYGYERTCNVGSNEALTVTKTHALCTDLTYSSSGYYYINKFPRDCSGGYYTFTGYSFRYRSPAGNQSNEVKLYVQYTANCGYTRPSASQCSRGIPSC